LESIPGLLKRLKIPAQDAINNCQGDPNHESMWVEKTLAFVRHIFYFSFEFVNSFTVSYEY
jgi:hypothetical protein